MEVAKSTFACGAVFAVFVAASLSAAEKPKPATEARSKSTLAQAVLMEDARLQKVLSLEKRYCTLGDALQAVTRETRVKLQAEAPLVDENVLLLIKERPAGELLDLLASQFGYYWAADRSGKGYELRQTSRAREREAQLREQDRRLAYADLERELAEHRRLLETPDKEVGTRWNWLLEQLRREDLPAAERERLKAEHDRVANVLLLGMRPMNQLLLGLTPSQRQRLLDGRPVQFSAAGEPHMDRLPTAVEQALRKTGADEVADWYRTHPPRDVRAEIRLRTFPGQRMLLRCRSELVGPGPPGYATGPRLPVDIVGKRPAEEALPAPEPTEYDDQRLDEKIRLAIPPKTPVPDDPSTYVAHTTLSDLLAAISEQAPRLSFISDCSLADLEAPAAKLEKVGEIVSAVTAQAGARWQFDPRGYVVLRSRFVYRNRVEAIPATLWRRFARSAQRAGGLTLLGHAQLAAAITDPQLNSLYLKKNGHDMRFVWPQINTFALLRYTDELRILASLRENELRALERGTLVPVEAVGPAARAAVVRAVEKQYAWSNRAHIEPVESVLVPQLALRLKIRPSASIPPNPDAEWCELEVLVPPQEPMLHLQIEANRADLEAAPQTSVR